MIFFSNFLFVLFLFDNVSNLLLLITSGCLSTIYLFIVKSGLLSLGGNSLLFMLSLSFITSDLLFAIFFSISASGFLFAVFLLVETSNYLSFLADSRFLSIDSPFLSLFATLFIIKKRLFDWAIITTKFFASI